MGQHTQQHHQEHHTREDGLRAEIAAWEEACGKAKADAARAWEDAADLAVQLKEARAEVERMRSAIKNAMACLENDTDPIGDGDEEFRSEYVTKAYYSLAKATDAKVR